MTYYDQWTDDAPGPSGHLSWKSGSHYTGQVGYSVSGKFAIKNYIVIKEGYVSSKLSMRLILQGEMYYHDTKHKYMGYWRKDQVCYISFLVSNVKRKGYGILIMPNGGRYWGYWKKGKVCRRSLWLTVNQRHGYGVELLEDGSFYEGSHGSDERRGKGNSIFFTINSWRKNMPPQRYCNCGRLERNKSVECYDAPRQL